MKKFKLNSQQINFKDALHFLSRNVIFILLIILVISQGERFVRMGSILGYQVRETKNSRNSSVAESNNIFGVNQNSLACDKASAKVVSGALNQDVERSPGFISDRTSPQLYSNCRYRTKTETGKQTRSVVVTLRGTKDSASALKSLDIIQKAGQAEEVKKLGDKAYYSPVSNQLLVAKDNKVATVIISKNSDTKFSIKTAATEIAEALIK